MIRLHDPNLRVLEKSSAKKFSVAMLYHYKIHKGSFQAQIYAAWTLTVDFTNASITGYLVLSRYVWLIVKIGLKI